MHKHAQACWGDGALSAADKARDAAEVRKMIVKDILCDGSIAASFECKGTGKLTYSFCSHTCAETWQVFLLLGNPCELLISVPRAECV
ncbi:hypothetical protein JVU11DRAFT_9684 [Chiua virens]|nr:hypothetical protein JVU11DRAFT_9684 [Chiua virens]